MIKYSKSSEDIIRIKNDYSLSNTKYLSEVMKINLKYLEQPHRKFCKICKNNLRLDIDFISHKVPYQFCTKCGHLNGLHEETHEFLQWLYFLNSGQNYGNDYHGQS